MQQFVMQAAGHNMLVLLQAYMEPSLDGDCKEACILSACQCRASSFK